MSVGVARLASDGPDALGILKITKDVAPIEVKAERYPGIICDVSIGAAEFSALEPYLTGSLGRTEGSVGFGLANEAILDRAKPSAWAQLFLRDIDMSVARHFPVDVFSLRAVPVLDDI